MVLAQVMREDEQDFWHARYWQAVLDRESRMDGLVYYAVLSTGVYCRPSCASRRPRRENVSFFERREDAEQAGYRPCLRCRPNELPADGRLELVQAVCEFIDARPDAPVTLQELARALGYSPFHIQRTFKALLGVSPRAWAESRRLERFKSEARRGGSVTQALYEAGYGSSSRLYQRGASQLGMTPAAYRAGGKGAQIAFTTLDTPLGIVLLAASARGLCAVRIGDSAGDLEQQLREEFPQAEVSPAGLEEYAAQVTRLARGVEAAAALPLDIRATAFQRRVWEALRAIPRGETRSYAQVAEAIGQPSATRAVARACAANPVALVIPCHRVVRTDGETGGYRWGAARKRRLLESEKTGTL